MESMDREREECKRLLKRIAWRLQYHARKQHAHEQPIVESMEAMLGTSPMELVLSDMFVQEYLKKIPSEKGRYVVRKTVIDGMTEQEVARQLHISRQGVNKCKVKYLDMLRQQITHSVYY